MQIAELELNFEQSLVDPCLLYRKTEEGTVFICVYVDDCILVGDRTAIEKVKDNIESKFSIKRLGESKEYIGVTVTRQNGKLYLSQPDVIKKIEKTFGTSVSAMRSPTVPLLQSYAVNRPSDDMKLISKEEQGYFCAGVGLCYRSLLYLVKHS
jgi:hypothetical protein